MQMKVINSHNILGKIQTVKIQSCKMPKERLQYFLQYKLPIIKSNL